MATAGTSAGGTPAAGASAGGALGTGGTSVAGSSASLGGAAGAGGTSGAGGANGSGGVSGSGGASSSGSFSVVSPDQADAAEFGKDFTCASMNGKFGTGVNPELVWSGAPAGTKAFAITFIDTKLGESSSMGQHWAAWNLPSTATKLPKATTMLSGDLAGGKQTNTYLAPCPTAPPDTYEFTVYALSAPLDVSGAESTMSVNSAGVAKVLTALKAVTPLGKAVLHGKCSATK